MKCWQERNWNKSVAKHKRKPYADIKTFEEIKAEIEADMRDFDNYEDENNVIEPAETKFFKNKDVKPRTYISSYVAENIQIELNAGKFIGKALEWGIKNE